MIADAGAVGAGLVVVEAVVGGGLVVEPELHLGSSGVGIPHDQIADCQLDAGRAVDAVDTVCTPDAATWVIQSGEISVGLQGCEIRLVQQGVEGLVPT